ncbi:acyl-CoA dehydrogenase [Leucobacter luti]|nr:acyl-CoA dehydrogenase [Leucobacter luti]
MAAGILVVGVGATYTLASWNDAEWVWGGADGDPNVGTSSFNVQQNASAPFTTTGWGDFETNPGDELTFTAGSLTLTPGDTIYAPVALQTSADSVAGTVQLQGAVAATGITVSDTGGSLWSAIRATVHTATGATPPAACTAAGAGNAGWTTLVTNAPLNTVGNATQTLAADAGSVQHYCFALTLPAGSPDTLQGRTIAPAWEFAATSN